MLKHLALRVQGALIFCYHSFKFPYHFLQCYAELNF
jgi:hypothetical protein